jgi:hypothetical protein
MGRSRVIRDHGREQLMDNLLEEYRDADAAVTSAVRG